MTLALLTGAVLAAQVALPLRIEQVGWLQGCWSLQDGDRRIEEQWLSPRADSMLGVGRTTRGETLVEHEFVVLTERDGRLAYEAHPSGQATATFLSKPITGREVVFENPTHDFPQRVGYRRVGADSVHAWVEGSMNGTMRRIEFPYARVPCPTAR